MYGVVHIADICVGWLVYIPEILSVIKTSQPTDDLVQAKNHTRNEPQEGKSQLAVDKMSRKNNWKSYGIRQKVYGGIQCELDTFYAQIQFNSLPELLQLE